MLCELDSLLTRFKQSKENLDKPCCDNLFETLKTKIPSFEDAAPHFGFKEPEIVELRTDCCSERQRRLQMLWKWMTKNGSDATYLAIVKVFLKMQNKQLAETVLEFCCEKELPSIDSHVNPSKVKKYRNWESMSKFEREKITNNLHVENRKIRMKYSYLVDNFLISLEKRNVQVSRLKLFLASYGVPRATLLNASTLADVLLIIQMSYSSWFNIQLFERIVEKFGSDDDKGNMRVYQESHLVPYLQRSIFEMPSKSFGAGNEAADCIALGLRLPDDFIPTGEDVAIIKHNLSQLLGIANEILLFIRYDEGSTILVFGLLDIAVSQRVIEKYFTPGITKRIYTFSGDLAQVLPPRIHQEGSIVHRKLKGFHSYTQRRGHRKFEKIAKRSVLEDIESQTGDQFFIDKEVYRRHMSELTDTIDDSSFSNFLIKYDLQIHLDELMQYFNPSFSRKRHFVSLKYMSSKYGYHLCYMALREAAREDENEDIQDNIQVVQALESTAREMGKKPPPDLFSLSGSSSGSDSPVNLEDDVPQGQGESSREQDDSMQNDTDQPQMEEKIKVDISTLPSELNYNYSEKSDHSSQALEPPSPSHHTNSRGIGSVTDIHNNHMAECRCTHCAPLKYSISYPGTETSNTDDIAVLSSSLPPMHHHGDHTKSKTNSDMTLIHVLSDTEQVDKQEFVSTNDTRNSSSSTELGKQYSKPIQAVPNVHYTSTTLSGDSIGSVKSSQGSMNRYCVPNLKESECREMNEKTGLVSGLNLNQIHEEDIEDGKDEDSKHEKEESFGTTDEESLISSPTLNYTTMSFGTLKVD